MKILKTIDKKLPQYISNNKLSILETTQYESNNIYILSNYWSHHFGLMPNRKTLGWCNGGACGDWDIHSNGSKIWEQHRENGTIRPCSAKNITSFIKKLSKYENMLNAWLIKNFGEGFLKEDN